MPLAKQIVGDQNIALLIAKLIATVVSLVWNYVLYNKLVFKKG
jgi:putative flippase GtrA